MILFNKRIYNLGIPYEHMMLKNDFRVAFFATEESSEEEFTEEYDKVMNAISERNEDELDGMFIFIGNGITFDKVEKEDLLEEALKKKGYKFERSMLENSLYVVNNDKEVVTITTDDKWLTMPFQSSNKLVSKSRIFNTAVLEIKGIYLVQNKRFFF